MKSNPMSSVGMRSKSAGRYGAASPKNVWYPDLTLTPFRTVLRPSPACSSSALGSDFPLKRATTPGAENCTYPIPILERCSTSGLKTLSQ